VVRAARPLGGVAPPGRCGNGRGRRPRGARRQSYHVTDEPVTWGEFAEALGEAVDGAPWLRVPERSTTRFGEGDGRSRPVAAGIESSLPHGDRLGARYRTVRRAGPPSSVRSNGSVSDTRAADRAQHAEGRASTKSNQ
jgi:hypothetical protein